MIHTDNKQKFAVYSRLICIMQIFKEASWWVIWFALLTDLQAVISRKDKKRLYTCFYSIVTTMLFLCLQQFTWKSREIAEIYIATDIDCCRYCVTGITLKYFCIKALTLAKEQTKWLAEVLKRNFQIIIKAIKLQFSV